MSLIIKKIKIAMLERQLKEVVGNIDFYSNLLNKWEKQRIALEPHKNNSFFEANEYNKIEGQIHFNRNRIASWCTKKTNLTLELKNLGVSVRSDL